MIEEGGSNACGGKELAYAKTTPGINSNEEPRRVPLGCFLARNDVFARSTAVVLGNRPRPARRPAARPLSRVCGPQHRSYCR